MKILWEANENRKTSSNIYAFAKHASEKQGVDLLEWHKLYKWSIENPDSFWRICSDFVGIRWLEKSATTFRRSSDNKMIGYSWFPGSKLNFAENLLPPKTDDVFIESFTEEKVFRVTGRELHCAVAGVAKYLRLKGVQKGDVVAGVLSNTYHAIVTMLATSSIGAVWSSCSPDFGEAGILDRFAQVRPKVLFYTPSYLYNGKRFDVCRQMQRVVHSLDSLVGSVVVPILEKVTALDGSDLFDELVNEVRDDIDYVPTEFDHPLYILFSSGTTGKPKAIVHGVGGTLLQHKKELILHTDIKPSDKMLYFTTCGWMMWNWMVSTLSTGAKLVTYDGSPSCPYPLGLWHCVSEQNVSVFGTSPRFLSWSEEQEKSPCELSLAPLRTVLSTGSPLLPEQFHWVYEHVKSDVHLASISGGTDIISCFMLGNPLLPVVEGQIQSAGLGMDIASFDQSGKPIVGEKGELVCRKAFPSMPVGFFNDKNGEIYEKAYFGHFPGQDVWRHGDYIVKHESGGVSMFGRSDATLNPGGVRIGTAEIYRCVEQLPYVKDSVAVGIDKDGDTQIFLFIVKVEGHEWSQNSEQLIVKHIRNDLTPRHVPSKILLASDIPYTRSGKKIELAVKGALIGKAIANVSAVSNPSSFEEYYHLGKVLGLST